MLKEILFTGIAYAQDKPAPKGPSTFEILVLPLGILLIMYFLIIRPQSKKAKEHANLINTLKVGDEVVTSGGIIGKIKSIADTFVTIEVSANSNIKVMKNHVSGTTKGKEAAPQKDK